MATAQVIDFLAHRKRVDLPVPLRTMTPWQYEQRLLMEQGEWTFSEINALQEVVMKFGDPVTSVAFIQDHGFTEQYQIVEGQP